MFIPGLFGGAENNIFMIVQTLFSLLFVVGIFFLPRLMIWQTDRKLRSALVDLDEYRTDAEDMFVSNMGGMDENTRNKFETLKDFKVAQPTGIDPSGLVGKMENILDASESKFNRFIDNNAETEDRDERANLNMAFKGVMGTNQVYKVMRHFRELINKTGNFQLIGMIQMMLPIYTEIAQSQKEATRAFVDQAPIGDSIGPLVAAKMVQSDEVEEISEDIVYSEEEIDGDSVHVLKSNGPGARLGKYGDAIEQVAEENDLEAIITIDASAKFEGEETGSIAEGVGVMMGGPGVEKTKIEEVATDHGLPLEGIVIKQGPPEASKPMKKEIYEAYKPAVEKVKELSSEFDGEVAVIGVGNTSGIGNTRGEVSGVHNSLRKYWNEYEQMDDEDDVSYMGLMGALPSGGNQAELLQKRDKLMWRMVR